MTLLQIAKKYVCVEKNLENFLSDEQSFLERKQKNLEKIKKFIKESDEERLDEICWDLLKFSEEYSGVLDNLDLEY